MTVFVVMYVCHCLSVGEKGYLVCSHHCRKYVVRKGYQVLFRHCSMIVLGKVDVAVKGVTQNLRQKRKVKKVREVVEEMKVRVEVVAVDKDYLKNLILFPLRLAIANFTYGKYFTSPHTFSSTSTTLFFFPGRTGVGIRNQ